MKTLSTFERKMKNTRFKKAFDKSYKKFLLSELSLDSTEKEKKSARKAIQLKDNK